MRASELLREASYNTDRIWYHGSGIDFDKFDVDAVSKNRTSNPSGIYLVKDEDTAREYADGIVYEVEPEVNNPFYDGRSEVTPEMVKFYKKLLGDRYVAYNGRHLDELGNEYAKTGKFKNDISGDIKSKVMIHGGYDAYFFNDMGKNSLVVFDPDDVTILNKFNPQQLKRDDKYDSPITTKKKTPNPTPQKKKPQPKVDDDDILGQMAQEFG